MSVESKNRHSVSRRKFIGAAAGGVATTAIGSRHAAAAKSNAPKWHSEADVVVVGAGAAGLPAAIRARDLGSSVILVEANIDIGGHAMLSGGRVTLGGGTRLQAKYKVRDSADQVYLDNTRPDHPPTRYADRKIVRAFANINVEAFDFLEANNVEFVAPSLGYMPMDNGKATAKRAQNVKIWPGGIEETINGTAGSGLVRPLEKSARAKGVKILLRHEMKSIVRAAPRSGRVVGIVATNLSDNTTVNIQARKAIITCTGGSNSNVVIRTIFDPRLTEEYCAGGEAWSLQSGAAEQCGMAIGASLGATQNARSEITVSLNRAQWIGCRDGYMSWRPDSPVFARAGGCGFRVADHQNTIHVNQLGRRFFDETAEHNGDIMPGTKSMHDYVAAALSSAVVDGPNGVERVGGPIWAIFDADAVKREGWNLAPPVVDIKGGYFYQADSLAGLAEKVSKNKHQKVAMSAAALLDTVMRYNSFVENGIDQDFGKPTPKYKIQTPPFYAAWAAPVLHDCLAGLRVNEKAQVLDIFGTVIPGFYCAGESAGGFSLHSLGKCIGMGYIAGTHAALEARVEK